jgi:hypothetical protein
LNSVIREIRFALNVDLSLRSRRERKAWGVSPRLGIRFEAPAHEMGGSRFRCKPASVARIRGLELLCFPNLGLTPQASRLHLLRRLNRPCAGRRRLDPQAKRVDR